MWKVEIRKKGRNWRANAAKYNDLRNWSNKLREKGRNVNRNEEEMNSKEGRKAIEI